MKKSLLILIACFTVGVSSYAQCFENEPDKYVCVNLFGVDTISLLKNPLFDEHEEYTYRWESYYTIGNIKLYASDFLNDTTLQNPLFVNSHVLSNENSVRFKLTVMSSDDIICVDSLDTRISSFAVLLFDTRSTINQGDSAVIFPAAGGGYAPYTYNWQPNYNILDITSEQTKVWPEVDTVYHVTFTDSVGCVSPITSWMIKVMPINAIDDRVISEMGSSVLSFPNPVYHSSIIELKHNVDPKAVYEIVIYRLDGVAITTMKLSSSNNSLAIGKLLKEEGIYLYSVYLEGVKIDTGKIYKTE